MMVLCDSDYDAAPIMDLINYCKGKHPWARNDLRRRILELDGKMLSTRTLLELFGFDSEEQQRSEIEKVLGIMHPQKGTTPQRSITVSDNTRSPGGWIEHLSTTPRIGGINDK